MLRRVGFGLAWALWVSAIVAMVFPWRDVTDHTHWGKVAWLPFVSGPLKASDIVGNVLLYVPFGYLGCGGANGVTKAAVVVALAGLLSLGTEAAQLYSHWRFPSATDVACNVAGCVVGCWLVRQTWRRPYDLSQETCS